eukprot:509454_1
MSLSILYLYLLVLVSTKYVINDDPTYQRSIFTSNKIGVIDILDEIYVEFNLVVNSFQSSSSQKHSSILHFGNNQIEKYPAIFIDDIASLIRIEFNSVSNHNQSWEYPITTNTPYNIQFLARQTNIILTINNIIIFNDSITSHSILFNRNIFLSNPWYNASNITLTGLIITTNNSITTPFNYLCDYNNRFSPINGTWTYNSTTCIVTQQDQTIEYASAWLGRLDITSLNWANYSIEMQYMLIADGTCTAPQCGAPDTGIRFRQTQIGDCYLLFLETKSKTIDDPLGFEILQNNTAGTSQIRYFITLPTLSLNELHKIRIDLFGDTFDVYIDNIYQITHSDNTRSFGSIGLSTYLSSANLHSLYITFPNNGQVYTQNPSNAPTLSPTDSTLSPSRNPSNTVVSNDPTDTPTQNPSRTQFISDVSITWSCSYFEIYIDINDPLITNIQSLTDNVCSNIFDTTTINLLGVNSKCLWLLNGHDMTISLSSSSIININDTITIKSVTFKYFKAHQWYTLDYD